jgi:hypothetical protein
MGDLAFAAGKETVEAHEMRAALQQSLAQVEAKKAGNRMRFSRCVSNSVTRGVTGSRQRLFTS